MFGKAFVRELMMRSAETDADRRRFLQTASAAGLGVVGASVLGGGVAGAASARQAPLSAAAAAAGGPSDGAILNFALNLEYLEGEFYHRAVYGHGLPDSITGGKFGRGSVSGGRAVPFKSKVVKQLASEIAWDETHHVEFLRAALGSSKVGRPDIDIKASFTAAARAAKLIGPTQTFDPYANENNFLLAAFIFEDVGVTAYKGAAPLISNKAYLEAAAGILAVEAYHASAIRLLLFERGLGAATKAISAARDSLDGPKDRDQGARNHGALNITPTDSNGIVYSRSAHQVLNIVYLTPKKATKGGFFPSGVNGSIHVSGDHS